MGWLICFGIAVLGGAMWAASPLDEARSAVSEWVEVESAISRESIAWEEKRALLLDLIKVAEANITMMKDQLAEAESATTASEARRLELVNQRENDAVRAKLVSAFLETAEPRVLSLVERLPVTLKEKLGTLLQALPEDPTATKIGLATRMQTVMGILAEIQRFDMMISTGEEIVTVADGGKRSVRTVHFGLGAAYYVAADGSDAGVGAATASGWEWRSAPELASEVEKAIGLASGAVMEARFLSLPVTLQSMNP